jgi:hypothetical protein
MKSVGLVLLTGLLLSVGLSESYELIATFFHKNHLPGTEEIKIIPAEHYGSYDLKERSENDLRAVAGNTLVVSEKGIVLEKNRLLSISKEEVREKGQYLIRDGYLHGIIEGDSLPAFQQDERYCFLMPSTGFFFDPTGDDKLYPGAKKDEFLLFSPVENGGYSAIAIWFKQGDIQLREIDTEKSKTNFEMLAHERKEVNGSIELILKPTEKDWEKLMGDFSTYDTYELQEN